MKKPTADDAKILLMLHESNNTPGMREAMTWASSMPAVKSFQEFKSKFPEGSEGARHVGEILGSFEMAGVLVSHGLLNENLYFDMSGIEFMWPKFEKIVTGMRKEMGPALFENAVWLAERQKKWKKKVWKPDLAWKK
jgi:hypothetical protein